MALSWLDLAVCVVALLTARWISRRKRYSSLPLPPGPPGLPIIGNLLNTPTEESWITFQRWRSEYGTLLYPRVFRIA